MKVAQDIDVFVVDFFDPGDREAAEALALEQQRLGVALGTLVFGERFLNGPWWTSLRWVLKLLNMENGRACRCGRWRGSL
jgi:hypothetical protein